MVLDACCEAFFSMVSWVARTERNRPRSPGHSSSRNFNQISNTNPSANVAGCGVGCEVARVGNDPGYSAFNDAKPAAQDAGRPLGATHRQVEGPG